MSKTNVGANLVFALRTKTEIKPMFGNDARLFFMSVNHRLESIQWAYLDCIYHPA